MRTRKREQTRGSGGMLPGGNFKFKSSEMAINASKTADSKYKFVIIAGFQCHAIQNRSK